MPVPIAPSALRKTNSFKTIQHPATDQCLVVRTSLHNSVLCKPCEMFRKNISTEYKTFSVLFFFHLDTTTLHALLCAVSAALSGSLIVD